MPPDLILFFAGLAAAGLLAGFVGGLFGVGGGVVIVPALYHVLGALGAPDNVRMHVAIATSLSTIVATSWRSMSTHAKAGAVDFAVLRAWTPWIALGAMLGAFIAGASSDRTLLIVFGVGILIVALNLAFGREHWRIANDLPRGGVRAFFAGAIGVLSAMMGIGGGTFGVALMTLCGRTIHQAVATASGFGAAIALPAAIVNVITGWNEAGLPFGSAGYVNLPGFVLLALLTMLTAPYGARMAHRLDRTVLKRAFAVFLVLMAANLLREAFA